MKFTVPFHTVVKYGRLQMLCRIPVLPGDDLSIDCRIGSILNPLRRSAGLEVTTELFAYMCPLRWTYGADLLEAMVRGASNPGMVNYAGDAHQFMHTGVHGGEAVATASAPDRRLPAYHGSLFQASAYIGAHRCDCAGLGR